MERRADGHINTTEWEEIQYKHGNKVGRYATQELELMAQKLAERHIDAPLETHDRVRNAYRDKEERGAEHGEELVDEDRDMAEAALDGEEDEDDIIARYRAARVRQMQEHSAQCCFGRVKPINGSHYIQEITDASKRATVVGVLIEQNHEGCLNVMSALEQIAAQNPTIKFVTCKSTEAIPNFPAKHLPCVVIYKEGAMISQLTGMEPWCRIGTTKPTVESVVSGLRQVDVLPRLEKESDDEEESRHYRSSKMHGHGLL